VAQRLQVRSSMIRSRFQCFVRDHLVCEGQMRGIAIPIDTLKAGLSV
jgi:hypothetical protein